MKSRRIWQPGDFYERIDAFRPPPTPKMGLEEMLALTPPSRAEANPVIFSRIATAGEGPAPPPGEGEARTEFSRPLVWNCSVGTHVGGYLLNGPELSEPFVNGSEAEAHGFLGRVNKPLIARLPQLQFLGLSAPISKERRQIDQSYPRDILRFHVLPDSLRVAKPASGATISQEALYYD